MAQYLDDSRFVFSDYPRMLRLDVPRRATINESPQLARLVGEAEREKGGVEISCEKTEAWGPFGIALLGSCIAVRQRLGRETQLVAPTDDEAVELFDETGLAEFATGDPLGTAAGQLFPIHADQRAAIGELASVLASSLRAAAVAAPAIVEPCLVTMLDNLFEWSESGIGGFAVVRWHKKTRQVRLGLIDRGLGIPAVLRRSHVGNLIRATDIDVIEAAFSDPAVTARAAGKEGLGLKQLRDTVLAHKGKLTVVSLGAKVSWVGERVNKSPSPPLRGTAIEIEMSP